jgi:hypothetical protein
MGSKRGLGLGRRLRDGTDRPHGDTGYDFNVVVINDPTFPARANFGLRLSKQGAVDFALDEAPRQLVIRPDGASVESQSIPRERKVGL